MPEPKLIVQLESLHADAFGWAVSCCRGDRALAEDVLQDAYVKIVDDRARPEGRSTVKTWWFGVIRLTAMEASRRHRRRQSLIGKLLDHWFPARAAPESAPAFETDEESARLRRLLSQLPARQAEVLHLVFYQELTLAEAAVVMGVSLGAVRQHYDRGKRRMRELLAAEAMPGSVP